MALKDPADPVVHAALQAAAELHEVPYELLKAVAWHESRFTPTAQSGVGAMGLMQIMPQTAESLGIDPWDPIEAAEGAARMLKRLHAKYEESWAHALAAYNWGPGNVNNAMAPLSWPTNTRIYVSKILSDAGLQSPFGKLRELFDVFAGGFLRPVPVPNVFGK